MLLESRFMRPLRPVVCPAIFRDFIPSSTVVQWYRGARSKEADGIEPRDREATVSVRDFSNKVGVDPPARSDNSRQLPNTFSGIADGSDVARAGGNPLSKSLQPLG